MIDVRGFYDLHVHTSPCLFPRLTDDRGCVRAAYEAGIGGIMLKSHHESTVSRAEKLRQEFPNIKIYGGIVLNDYAGGFNPQVVEESLKFGGKGVWMPTIEADYHVQIYGSKGKFDVMEGEASANQESRGLTILDEQGKIKKNVQEILKLIAEYKVILSTCHLSPPEIYSLVKTARTIGVQKILITHPFLKTPGLGLDQLRELIALGAKAEFCYCTVSPMWHHATVQQVAAAIKEIKPTNAIITSDSGQCHNPMPHESLRVFAQCLYECGLSKKDIVLLAAENPMRLLEE